MKKSLFSFTKYVFALLLFICSISAWGQTTTLAQWTFPSGDTDITKVDVSSTVPDNSAKILTTQRDTSCGNPFTAITTAAGASGSPDQCAVQNTWAGGANCKYWAVDVNTTGYKNIKVSSKQGGSNTAPKNFKLQYKVGSTGTWADVTGGGVVAANNFTTGILTNVALPTDAENSTQVFLRWLMTTSASINNSTVADGGNSRIDDILITGEPLSTNTITTSGITGSPFCVSSSAGASVSVGFTSVGTFTSGNVYTAQLSDATGSFVSATNIGTLTSTGNTGSISATIPAGAAASAGYRIRVVSSSPLVTGTDNGINLMVSNSAVITGQSSTSTQTLCQGNTATPLSVTATGASTYQWYSNTSNSNSGGTSLGIAAQTSSYTPSTATVGTLYYYCIVTGGCGSSAISNVSGAITVNAVPTAPTNANITATQSCGSTSLSYSGSDASSSYWQTTNNGMSTTNVATSAYVVSSNATVYIRSYNGTCWSAATSYTPAVVSSPSISGQPSNTSVVAPATATFSVTATNAAGYQWQINTGSAWVDISGVISSSYTTGATAVGMSGAQYRVIVKATAPCTDVISDAATLTVTAAPVAKKYELVTSASQLVAGKKYLIVSTALQSTSAKALGSQISTYRNQSANIAVTAAATPYISVLPATTTNSTAPFELTLGGSTGSWTLQDAVNANNYLYSNSTNQLLNRASNSDNNGVFTIAIDGTSYNATITSTGNSTGKILSYNSGASRFSCYSSSQSSVYLYVESECQTAPADPVGTISGTTPACNSTSLTYSGSDSANAYWVSSASGTETTAPAASTQTVTASGTYYVRIKNGNCWSDGNVNYTVAINTPVSITTQPINTSVTPGSSASFTVATTGGNETYQWQVSTDCGVSWSDISGETSATYAISSTDISMNGNRYRVKVNNTCGTEVTSNAASLTVAVSSNCISDDFDATNWGSSGTNGYVTGLYTVNSGTWVLANVSVSVGNSRAQLRYDTTTPASLQLPDLSSNALKLYVYAATSSSSGTGIMILQYKDNSGTWVDYKNISLSGSNILTLVETADLTAIPVSAPIQLRLLHSNLSTNAYYIGKIEVECKVTNDYTWTGGAGTTSWDDICNWSPKGKPTSTDNVTFSNTTTATNTLNITDSRAVNNFTMSGTGQFNMASTGVLTIDGDTSYAGTATATLDCASTIKLASASSVSVLPLAYGNLDLTGGARVFPEQTVSICNILTTPLASANYTVNDGSTIEYNGADQTISNKLSYYNITFSGSGTKTPVGAISVNTLGTVKITGTAIADFKASNLASTSTNTTKFAMDGGRLILGTVGSQPNMRGNYQLTGGVIEYANKNTTDQTIRNREYTSVTNTGYQNIEITGNTVANSSGIIGLNTNGVFTIKGEGIYTSGSSNAPIKGYDATSILKIEDNGIFKTNVPLGFYGALSNGDYPSVFNNVTLDLQTGSTVEYSRATTDGNQTVTLLPAGYQNLTISGVGEKTVAPGKLLVNQLTKVTSATLKLSETADNIPSNVLEAKGGLQNNGGIVLFENNAQLMQDVDAANSGNITMLRKASVPKDQYNFWAAPVSGMTIGSMYSGFQKVMRYNTETNNFTTIANSTQFDKGRGYSVKGSSNNDPHTVENGNFSVTTTFVGTPNNGDVSLGLSTKGARYNLVGNPYPSNINLDVLYADNASVLDLGVAIDSTKIQPTMYFWDNINNPFTTQISNYNGQNYAVYNAVSKTGISATSGSQTKKPNGLVKPGQGFMVRAKSNNGADSVLSFLQSGTSALRVTANVKGGTDAPYYKGGDSIIDHVDRFWVRLTTPNNIYNTIAVVYKEKAQNTYDLFDSMLMNGNASDLFYSFSNDGVKLAIQGRKGIVSTEDVVPLGFKNLTSGLHTISIVEKQGVFESGQTVYLKDKALDKIVDITNNSYTYNANLGSDDSRFEIVYKEDVVLGVGNGLKSDFVVYRDGSDFVVKSSKTLGKVEVYDTAGRLVVVQTTNNKILKLNTSTLPEGVFIIKAENSGDIKTKKIIK